METPMLARVEDALRDWITENRDALEGGGGNAEQAARVAIAAMREPTEAMREAYTEAASDFDGPAAAYLQTAAYRAMIDAALAEEPSPADTAT